MGSQLPALEQLFDEWSKKHKEKLSTEAPYFMPEQEEPYGGFVRDGIVNLESWKQQKVRICFILNEAGGRFNMLHYPDGADLAAEWNEKGSFSKFMFKVAIWTKAIQDAFGQPTTYKKSDIVKIRDDLIRSIAVVNIKKSDGNRRTDFSVLRHFANEDADELRREIELLNPNIIICCENLKFLREPFQPRPPKNKPEGEEVAESTDTTVASDTTVATAEPAENSEPAENTETVTIPAAENDAETETEATLENEVKHSKRHKKIDTTESATVAAVSPLILPQYREDGKRNYVFNVDELRQIAKFTYLWGNKLVLSLWTPANFTGTISSNTLNYYAVREVVRAALKAFGDKQRKQKVKQLNDQRHKEKLQQKQEAQQKKAAKEQAQPEQAAATPAENPEPAKVAETPAPAAETKPKATKTTKAKKAETPAPEVAPQTETLAAAEAPAETKPKTRRTTKKAAEDTATETAEAPKKTTRRTKKVTTEE